MIATANQATYMLNELAKLCFRHNWTLKLASDDQ